MAVIPEDTLRRVADHPTTHLRVLGPPGSGKTRLLVERFRAIEARHGGGVCIVTYSAENHRRLTDAVLDKNTGRVGPTRVLTYSRLAEGVIEAAGARAPLVVTDLEELLLLEEVIAGRESRLTSDLRSICRSERFRNDLRETFHVLLQNNVAGARLAALEAAAASERGASAAELSDVLVLYEGFRRALDARGAATYYDIAWKALEAWGTPDAEGNGARESRGEGDRVRCHPLSSVAAVLVDDFQDIDAGQFALLTSLVPPGGAVALEVFGDPMGSVFAHRGTQHRFLMEEFPRAYGGETFCLPARRYENGVPEQTLEALLSETVREEARDYLPVVSDAPDEAPRGEGVSRGFRIDVVRDEMEEMYVVAARIANLLREGTFRPEEIAIVANEKRRYDPLLVAAATQRGIPLDTGRAGKTVFAGFADALLALVDSPDDPVAARAVLTSPLHGAIEDPVTRPGRGGEENDAPAENALRAYVADLRQAIAAMSPARWMESIVAKCFRGVCDAHAKVTGDASAYQDMCGLLEAWERYASAVERWGGRPSVGAFAALDESLSRARPAARRRAVSFLSCREAKGRFFPAVFVIGCSELLFPSAGRSENVLPMAALEKALRRACSEPVDVYRARSAEGRLREEHHFLAIALTRATKVLCITAPEAFSGEDYPAPSAILDRAVPGPSNTPVKTAEKIPPQIRFAEAWVRRAPFQERDPRLERLSPAGFRWHAPPPEEAPVRLEPFPLSQSTIGSFLACERRFFYRKALRLPEADAPPMKVGKLFHEVMAALGRRFATKAELIAGFSPAVVSDIVDDVLRKDEDVAKAPFFEWSLRHHLARMAEKVVDIERSDPGNYIVRAIEKPIPFHFGPWEFTGRVDRVHETPDGRQAIVDYKTGKIDKMPKTLHRKTLAALEDPKKANWQLPIYAWGVKATEGRTPGAFTFVATPPREEPIAVTLFIRRDENDPPPEDEKGRPLPHLLESQIESVMESAARVAEAVFAPRSRFERTDDTSECRNCDFKRLCRREET